MSLQVFMRPGAYFFRDGHVRDWTALKQALPSQHVYFEAAGPEFYKRRLGLN